MPFDDARKPLIDFKHPFVFTLLGAALSGFTGFLLAAAHMLETEDVTIIVGIYAGLIAIPAAFLGAFLGGLLALALKRPVRLTFRALYVLLFSAAAILWLNCRFVSGCFGFPIPFCTDQFENFWAEFLYLDILAFCLVMIVVYTIVQSRPARNESTQTRVHAIGS